MILHPHSYRIIDPNKRNLALSQAERKDSQDRRPLGDDGNATSLGDQFRKQSQNATQLWRSHQRGA